VLSQAAAAVGLPPDTAELPAAAQEALLGAAEGALPAALLDSTAASAAGSAADESEVVGSSSAAGVLHEGMSDVLGVAAEVASSGGSVHDEASEADAAGEGAAAAQQA
jgi:hypothetical protein